MGDFGSFQNNYKLGEKVAELKGVTVLLDGSIDDFIGDCDNCGSFFDIGAKILDGRVAKVFILKEIAKTSEKTEFPL